MRMARGHIYCPLATAGTEYQTQKDLPAKGGLYWPPQLPTHDHFDPGESLLQIHKPYKGSSIEGLHHFSFVGYILTTSL